jgi:hypothetical protein
MDVKTAYLEAPLDEELYLQLPAGFHFKKNCIILDPQLESNDARNNIPVIVRLQKSIYSLRQAGLNWFCTLHEYLTEDLHMMPSQHIAGLYTTPGGVVIDWVNDIVASGEPNVIKRIEEKLLERFSII